MTKELVEQPSSPTEPWSDFDRAFSELSARLFDPWGVLASERPDGPRLRPARTDVTDTGAAYRIVAEVPGIPKEKLDIRVRGTTVELKGETSETKETNGTAYVHRERTYAGYYRLFDLPEPVVATEAKAKVENGLLELELPKQHPSPDEVQVRVP